MTARLLWPRSAGEGSALLSWRIGWASPQARELWAPRLARLFDVALSTELALVADGTVGHTIVRAEAEAMPALIARAAALGLAAMPVAAVMRPGADGERRLECDLRIGQRSDVDLPDCCAAAGAGRRGPLDGLGAEGRVDSAHLLLGLLGVGPLRHAPCHGGCRATAERIARFRAAMAAEDEAAVRWIDAMERWPVQWSVVAGIGELTTPVFRYAVLLEGVAAQRIEAGRRIAVPAREPAEPRHAAVRVAAAIADDDPGPALFGEWTEGYADGYSLRAQCAAILWQSEAFLARSRGKALHYPCGDAVLLQMLADRNPRWELTGVDPAPGAVAAACRRLKGRKATLIVGRLPPAEVTARGSPDDAECPRVAFVGLGALAAAPAAERAAWAAAIEAGGMTVIGYADDRAQAGHGDLARLADAAGLAIAERLSGRRVARMAVRVPA